MYQTAKTAMTAAMRSESKMYRKTSREIRYPPFPCKYSTTRNMLLIIINELLANRA